MKNFSFTIFLIALIGAGFFSGYNVGQISHLVGGWVSWALTAVAMAIVCLSLVGAVWLGAFAFAHEIEKCQIVKHEDGRPMTITLMFGPWKWARDVPTEIITEE